MKTIKIFTALILLSISSASFAMPIDAPLPDGRFISDWEGTGLDVAWAAPCNIFSPSCGVVDLSFQSTLGWRVANMAEITLLTANLDATDFVFAGANGAFNGSSNYACASAYFSTAHSHCDWNDGNSGRWDFGDGSSPSSAWEGVVVRSGANAVPEPSTLALLGLGLAGIGFAKRKKA